MREYEIARDLALALEHLKATRRAKKMPDSDKALAEAINSEGKSLPGWENLGSKRVHMSRHGKDTATIAGKEIILRAVEAAIDAVGGNMNRAARERNYRHKLEGLIQHRISQLFQGQPLDPETIEAICGAWQFFYLSPIDRSRKYNRPEFRGIGVFVHQAIPNERTIEFFIISGHRRWDGEAFVTDSHLCMMCSDTNKSEAALFLTNKPRKEQPFVSGVGAGLERLEERGLERVIRPALGFLCFGQKWPALIAPKSLKGRSRTNNSTAPATDMIELVNRAVMQEKIEPHEETALRNFFCKGHSMASLRQSYPDLFTFMQSCKINRKKGYIPEQHQWLYFEWP